jgi:site-specific DNA-methyltransferase (adenine-specific)
LTKQVYGIGITQLTALLARRSVYCSKDATGSHSVAKSFDRAWGNIWFERTEHTWAGDRCGYCGAGKSGYGRGDELETHAYAFIHTTNPRALLARMFGADVQFDVIIGNPPYQLDDGGFGTSAAPIYHEFVTRALELDPRFAVFITPSRWFAGGKGLDAYRAKMLSDRRMSKIVDFPKLYDGFPGVKIRGGVSYFLWEREHNGSCSIQTMWDEKPLGPAVQRKLDAYDVLVRRNEAVSILDKVRAFGEPTLDARVSSRKPFGLATNYRGKSAPDGMSEPIMLFANQRTDWIDRKDIPAKSAWVDAWKVLMTRVQGTSAAIETKFLSKPIIAQPGTATTETYLVAGRFESEAEATSYAQYLSTRFVRFLVSLRKHTQDAARGVYAFAPDLPLDRHWSDADLYDRYDLTLDEIAFIESQVAEHDV